MAQFILNLPDAQLPRLVVAVGKQTGQDTSVMTSPQKVAMVKAHITNFLINTVQASEVPDAERTAAAAKITEIASGITVT